MLYAPLLTTLPIIDRTNLLKSLQETIKGYKNGFDREKIRAYFIEHAHELLMALRNKILSDPSTFQRGYSCENLKELTNALNLSLIENDREGPSPKNVL